MLTKFYLAHSDDQLAHAKSDDTMAVGLITLGVIVVLAVAARQLSRPRKSKSSSDKDS
jgi:hypothetical protein